MSKKYHTTVISAFPGMGKTYCFNNIKDKKILDSDSSKFSWKIDDDENKVRNPDFPENYMDHIKQNLGKCDYIFVSSHREVRDALINNSIFFNLIYPDKNRKEEFLKRYSDRGSDDKFISLLKESWDNWIDDCDSYGLKRIGCTSSNAFEYVSEFIEYFKNFKS